MRRRILRHRKNAAAAGPVPVSYYKMEDNVIDSVGSNHGTNENVTFTDGLVNRTAVFNGTTSRIITANDINHSYENGSVVCVLKTSNAGTGFRGVVIKQTDYGFFLIDNVLSVYSWGTPVGIKSTGINVADNLFHVVVYSFQKTVTNGAKIYLDGNLVLTTTMSEGGTITNPITIGAGRHTNPINQQFAGEIDEVGIYDVALTQEEAIAITEKLQSGESLI